MAVPSYEEIIAKWNVDSSLMELAFSEGHLIQLSSEIDIDICKLLAIKLQIPPADTKGIMSHRNVGVEILECWRQRRGSMATYKELAMALLGISRTDLAEKVVALVLSVKETTTSVNQTPAHTRSMAAAVE